MNWCGRVSVYMLMTACLWWVVPSARAAEAAAELDWDSGRRAVPREHPRLLGTRAELQELARSRPEAYERMVHVARERDTGDERMRGRRHAATHATVISLALVAAIEEDRELAREAIKMVMPYIEGPIRRGHVTFGHDLAQCAIVFDLCHEHWTDEERAKFIDYFNRTVDANVGSERHVFHNGWWGYKNWGIGLAGYATYHENARAAEILATLEEDYRERAAPALRLAGDGGGWAEGYYIHYFIYEWLMFCEVARRVEGVDYYALAPEFYPHRAIASMFEMYPGTDMYGSRRPIPMGDGGGRIFGGDRDKALSARRMLVNHFRNDPAHQVVHAFNETTPVSGSRGNAYKDFLWRDGTVSLGDLEGFRLSHLSRGPGHVHARSSWGEDATYFFFTCGDRFTAHQHLDVGHFLIYRHEELAGDGGHYDGFGTRHDVNYHLRTIAHSTMLVHDPEETWPDIRRGPVTGNDGGQSHNWPHHNGASEDPQEWHRNRELYRIADLLAFEDSGDYLYVAGDASRAYSSHKLDYFTRQIVYIRPGTFVIFDRVRSTDPAFKKTWLLQAMTVPERQRDHLVITNGQGRLFVQSLLPEGAEVRLASGYELYRYGGENYRPRRDTGPAPQCRIEISPASESEADYFLHVLTAADVTVERVEAAAVDVEGDEVIVRVEGATIGFGKNQVSGWIERDGERSVLEARVVTP